MPLLGHLIFVGLALVATSAAAQQRPLPKEVQAVIQESRESCQGEGKKDDLTVGKDAIRKLDLNGDGIDDYIVDHSDIKCGDSFAFFCGTGGCTLHILVAKRDGTFALVFEGQVRKYILSAGPGPRTIRFHLHGGFCGRAGAYDCRKSQRITGAPFEYKDR